MQWAKERRIQTIRLTHYISGKTVRSERTITKLRHVLEKLTGAEYELTVCDVLEEPQAAERAKILATPTLIVTSSPPVRRVIGDLAEADKVLAHLGLSPEMVAEGKKGS